MYYSGSKLLLTIRQNKASRNLENHYLGSVEDVYNETHHCAFTAYLADFVVGTGELNFAFTHVPTQSCVSSRQGANSTTPADSARPFEYLPMM